ncbi:Kinesin-4 [Platanthera zijinensis]|uniref:Kinesin-like protein n=1 Tax=Platanthera zijinensis TaxID=2320716 RepID=A0AAP0BD11_9ASPA
MDASEGKKIGISEENKKYSFAETKYDQPSQNLLFWDPMSTPYHPSGNKSSEVFQLKQAQCSELISPRSSKMIDLNSPIHILFSTSNDILDEFILNKNGEIQRSGYFLKEVVQEIERRFASQSDLYRRKYNEVKFLKDEIKTLKTPSAEVQIPTDRPLVLQTEKEKNEEKILAGSNIRRLLKEKEDSDTRIIELMQVLESTKKSYEEKCEQLEIEASDAKQELEGRLKDSEFLLEESRRVIKALEATLEAKLQNLSQKEHILNAFMSLKFRPLQELRTSAQTIKQEVIYAERKRNDELVNFGMKLKVLTDEATNYHNVLLENRKLYNEVQELKGNIRVYCRIRPFLVGETRKSSIVGSIGENGELVVLNPSKQVKDGEKMFKFNKVYGPSATQGEVFLDIQPLVRSVLDGYNVCIFAYGQTGSGKTYTMSGPDSPTEEVWGVNYRALNDLFHISQSRRNSILYEVGVQMIEIYNEQVRDLLANDPSQKKLGILSSSQPNGLAVPNAIMHPVNSTSDVLELMNIGQTNRAVSATALNTSSSRSHCVVTVHIRGSDLKTRSTLCGSLHLVDLAGSERVDRSEVMGDRLKEAQHINKSLSALGDVIFSLSQKNAHVPYRNSKLTQVLQSSLGGHAKTLMFVQINPDANSYLESLSALKFAERVSGVELGAARINKEGNDVSNLMEKVVLLEETLARKDEEIDHLQMLLDTGTVSFNVNNKKHEKSMLRHSSSSPEISFKDNSSCRSEISFQQIIESNRKGESLGQPKDSGEERGRTYADMELLGLNGADSEEFSSDISDGDLIHMGKETERSAASAIDFSHFPEPKSIDNRKQRMSKVASQIAKPLQERAAQATPPRPKLKDTLKSTTSKEILRPPALRDTIRTSNSKDSPKSSSMKKISTSPAALSSGKMAANH